MRTVWDKIKMWIKSVLCCFTANRDLTVNVYVWFVETPPCRINCGRQGEPANLISTFIQTHARQFYSLALTRFFSIFESSTTNVWNAKNAFLSPPSRVIWILDHMKVMYSSSADQSNLGVDVSIHVKLYMYAISGRNLPQAFLKWIAGMFFQESYFTSGVKRRCCSTLTLQGYSLRLLIVVRPWSHWVCGCCSTSGVLRPSSL